MPEVGAREDGNNSRTAIIVVDMQKAFTDPQGSAYYETCGDIVEPIRRLVEEARAARVLVVWTLDWHRRDIHDAEFRFLPEHCVEGTTDTEFSDALSPAPGEPVILKRRYSAFFGTDLDMLLRDYGTENLIIVGNKTNVCVRATVQDAFAYGYKVTVVRDCVTSNRRHLHEASLEDIHRYFGKVISLEDAIRLIRAEYRGETR